MKTNKIMSAITSLPFLIALSLFSLTTTSSALDQNTAAYKVTVSIHNQSGIEFEYDYKKASCVNFDNTPPVLSANNTVTLQTSSPYQIFACGKYYNKKEFDAENTRTNGGASILNYSCVFTVFGAYDSNRQLKIDPKITSIACINNSGAVGKTNFIRVDDVSKQVIVDFAIMGK